MKNLHLSLTLFAILAGAALAGGCCPKGAYEVASNPLNETVPIAAPTLPPPAEKPTPSAPRENKAPAAPQPTTEPTPSPAAAARTEQPAPIAEIAPLSSADLPTVSFAFESYSLDADAQDALDKIAGRLAQHPDVLVLIEGHCDERGETQFNFDLGERRAFAVRDYLQQAGVAAARMEAISHGETRPVDTGHGESAWSRNRIVRISLR